MKKSKKLSRPERDEIQILLERGYSMRRIAGVLRRSPNTVSYEVERNGGREGYCAARAHQYARTRKKDTRYQWKKINDAPSLEAYIIEGLQKAWNPDEISHRMKKENHPFYASKTTIYEWLRSPYGQYYCRYLYSRRYRRKPRKPKAARILIPHRISIEKRPRGAAHRTRFGHWETDAVVSKKGCPGGLQTGLERKSRLIHATVRARMKPDETVRIIRDAQQRYVIGSLTYDNGIENRYHAKTGVPSYFCDPYSSWQKGAVENANKMIRRFFPKGTDFSLVSQSEVDRIVMILNNKPRKILGYRTALEVARAAGIIKGIECPN